MVTMKAGNLPVVNQKPGTHCPVARSVAPTGLMREANGQSRGKPMKLTLNDLLDFCSPTVLDDILDNIAEALECKYITKSERDTILAVKYVVTQYRVLLIGK